MVLAAVSSGDEVLDLGTGTGALVERFLAQECQVTGVDFSAEMLRLAQARLPAATWLQADLLGSWPVQLGGQQFSLAVSGYVFHEFTDNQKLELIRNVFAEGLQSDGRLVIADIAFPNSAALEACRADWRNQWDDDEHYWIVDEMLEALQEQGIHGEFTQVSFCAGVFGLSKVR